MPIDEGRNSYHGIVTIIKNEHKIDQIIKEKRGNVQKRIKDEVFNLRNTLIDLYDQKLVENQKMFIKYEKHKSKIIKRSYKINKMIDKQLKLLCKDSIELFEKIGGKF